MGYSGGVVPQMFLQKWGARVAVCLTPRQILFPHNDMVIAPVANERHRTYHSIPTKSEWTSMVGQ